VAECDTAASIAPPIEERGSRQARGEVIMYRLCMAERTPRDGASTGAKRKRAEPAPAAKPTTARRRTAPKAAAAEPTGPTVLVVDDEPEIREWLKLSLSLRGWTVEEATTADDALERMTSITPDVVLLDHQLPGTKGIDFAAELRKMSSDLRIIMSSAYIDPAVMKRARDLQILPMDKTDHKRLFDLFELLAEHVQASRTSVR
jgi:CheY-like chemotaxis protein